MDELLTRCERRFRFSSKELVQIAVTVLVAAFVITFRSWGGDEFNLSEGLTNLVLVFIVAFILFMIHFSVQKIVALRMGYESEYRFWINGMIISLIVAFFTNGFVPLFFTGSLWHEPIEKLRVGVFRGGAKHKDIGYISFAGPFSNMILVLILTPIFLATQSAFLQTVIIINLLIAIYSLLPLPTFEKIRRFKGGTTGLYIFIASRWVFVLVFVTFIAFAILLWLIPSIFSFIIALLLGIITTVIYYLRYEAD